METETGTSYIGLWVFLLTHKIIMVFFLIEYIIILNPKNKKLPFIYLNDKMINLKLYIQNLNTKRFFQEN